ncbi:hypothetical protein B0J18DRAFT_236583 [Chaetomium sp. MPI-SDFR-AT-0129]|nr:hypothetical protein B0J18DRAFT_236583 [Chaetomium sp. MPI-SDFR-AT-0129]
MPMIYGEGDRAFRRLQEQVMKELGDDSILAWGLQPDGSPPGEPPNCAVGATPVTAGALAPSPSSFKNLSRVVVLENSRQPSSLELQGGNLRLSLPLLTLHRLPPLFCFGAGDRTKMAISDQSDCRWCRLRGPPNTRTSGQVTLKQVVQSTLSRPLLCYGSRSMTDETHHPKPG